MPVTLIATAMPPESSAPAVLAPVSEPELKTIPVATVVALSSTITYFFSVSSVDLIVINSFSDIPLSASPSATVIVAVAALVVVIIVPPAV